MEQLENLEQSECIEDLSVQKETVEKPENAVNDENEDISSDEEVQNLSVEKNENDQMEMETETIEKADKVVEPQQQQQPQQQEEQNNPDETNKEKETTENEMEQDEKGVDLSSFLRVEMNDESSTNGPNEQQKQQQPEVKAEVDKTEEIIPAPVSTVSTVAPEPVASSDENIKTEIKSEEIPATASSENAEKDNDSETSDDDEVFLPVLRSFTTIKTA